MVLPSFRRHYTTAVKNAVRRTDTSFERLRRVYGSRFGPSPMWQGFVSFRACMGGDERHLLWGRRRGRSPGTLNTPPFPALRAGPFDVRAAGVPWGLRSHGTPVFLRASRY